MGMFFPEEEEHFTGRRKTGFPRYKEVLEGSWKEFFLVGFMTLLFFLPFAGGMVYAVLTSSALVALLAGLAGGAIAGPGFACLIDILLRRLRSDKDDWWASYKRAFRQNWRAAILPGVVQCVFLGVIVYGGALMYWGAGAVTPATLLLLLFASLLLTMLMSAWWPQVVLFEQKALLQIKNALLFCIFHFWKVARSAILEILWWVILILFLPWTAFVVPILGVWYIKYVALFLLYPLLDEDFRIEEQIEEKFPGVMEE